MLTRKEILQNLVIVPLEMYMLMTLISSQDVNVLIFKKQFAYMVQDTYYYSFNSISTKELLLLFLYKYNFHFGWQLYLIHLKLDIG